MKGTRRIQVTGGATYIVSLPPEWIRSSGLKKGSEVVVRVAGKHLQISPAAEGKIVIQKTLLINGEPDVYEMQRAMTSLYIAGFDTLIIRSGRYINKTIRDAVTRFARMVMGVEVIEETSNAIVLQNVIRINTFPEESAIRRMILMIRTMIEDVIKGLRTEDLDLLKNVIERDAEVDRYQWYIYRETRLMSEHASSNTFNLILSRILERIADHSVNISSIIIKGGKKGARQAKVLLEFLEFSYRMFEDAIKEFYADDFTEMNSLIERKLDIVKMRDSFLFRNNGRNSGLNMLLVEEITRIGFYSTDIAELSMDRMASSVDTLVL